MASHIDLPTTTLLLVGASAATSYIFYSNVGLTQFGAVALLNGSLAPDVKVNAYDKVKAWNAFYSKASKWMVGISVLGAGLNIATALNHPSPTVRQLSGAAAAVAMSIVPFTFGFIMPTNRELQALDENIMPNAPADSANAQKADELVLRWEGLHNWRYVGYAGAWVLTTVALVLDNRA